MKCLPYDCWTIESPLDVPSLVAGMQERIEPFKWFRLWFSDDIAPLEGTVHQQGFSVRRIIGYRNSFLPMLYGTFIPNPNGTTIRIRMMPHPLVVGFMVNWLGLVGLFAISGLVMIVQNGEWWLFTVASFMGGAGLLLSYGCFFAEAGKAKRLVSDIILDIHRAAVEDGAPRAKAEAPRS